jgi:hypothetical protein
MRCVLVNGVPDGRHSTTATLAQILLGGTIPLFLLSCVITKSLLRSDILAMHVDLFRDVTTYSLTDTCRRFGGT